MAIPIQLPPGLSYDAPLVEVAKGGDSMWCEYEKVKLYTNAFVILNDSKVLLGLKKRGFGVGIWNGFGGKVDPGETSLQAAIRELEEEAGIVAPLEHCGTLFFVGDDVEAASHIDIFRAYQYTGLVAESDEMRPEWFSIPMDMLPPNTALVPAKHRAAELPPIPIKQMWADDEFWLPLMFARRHFVGRVDVSSDNKMLRWWFGADQTTASS